MVSGKQDMCDRAAMFDWTQSTQASCSAVQDANDHKQEPGGACASLN
jgi:hypothetical protein